MELFSSSFFVKIVKFVVVLKLLICGTKLIRFITTKYEDGKLAKIPKDHFPKEHSHPRKKRSFWRMCVPILIGSGFFGLFVVRRVHPEYRKPGQEATKWEVTFYTLLPLRIISRVWGSLMNIDLPMFMRSKIYSLYANSFGVNLEECKVQDLTCYKSLSEFFIRPLKEECRPIDLDCTCIVSPADGRVLTFGKVTSCQVDQVKGVTYSLQQFLGKQSWKKINNHSLSNQDRKKKFSSPNFKESDLSNECESECESSDNEENQISVAGFPGYTFKLAEGVSSLSGKEYLERLREKSNTDLYHCVVYLAPGDYHRFHSPVDWKIKFRRHFQGKLLSVNPAVASWINNLFSLNERAVYIGSWEHGFFSLTAVGATNVGFIRVVFDPSLQTNRWVVSPRERDLFFTKDWRERKTEMKMNFDKPVEMGKGQLFGEFRLGSTVVLIFEAPKNFQFNIEKGQKIKYGQKIGAYAA